MKKNLIIQKDEKDSVMYHHPLETKHIQKLNTVEYQKEIAYYPVLQQKRNYKFLTKHSLEIVPSSWNLKQLKPQLSQHCQGVACRLAWQEDQYALGMGTQ